MKCSVEEIASKLKTEYAHELRVQEGRRKRKFSREFKHRVVQEIKSNQIPESAMAIELGISLSAIRNWRIKGASGFSKQVSKNAVFRKLEIGPDAEASESHFPYLEGRSGVRVIGLSLNQMAELLRCL